jgi:diacylglycerol kinase family enzyme
MTARVDDGPALDELFLCLVSNVSPWTYLGARAINPSPDASFDAGLDLFALGRIGSLRMTRTFLQTIAPRPDARGRGVHRLHDLPQVTLRAERPQRWQLDGDHLGTAGALRLQSVPAALRVVA